MIWRSELRSDMGLLTEKTAFSRFRYENDWLSNEAVNKITAFNGLEAMYFVSPSWYQIYGR